MRMMAKAKVLKMDEQELQESLNCNPGIFFKAIPVSNIPSKGGSLINCTRNPAIKAKTTITINRKAVPEGGAAHCGPIKAQQVNHNKTGMKMIAAYLAAFPCGGHLNEWIKS